MSINKNYRKEIGIIVLFIIIPSILFWNIVFTDTMLYRGDGAGYMAAKELLKNILSGGELPIWNRFNALGTPFSADIQNAVFYPFNILTMLLPLNMGFELYFTLHLSLAAIGMYFYLKNMTQNTIISLVGGIILMFSNILIIRFNHINIMASIAWMPFILLATDILIQKKKTKNAIILGCLLALQFLAGFPQIAIYSDIFIFFYYIAFNLNNRRRFIEIVKEVLIFISSYFGIIAIQIFPLAQLILFSQRDQIGYNFFISYSQSWKMLIQMIFPAFWGAGSSNLNIAVEFPTDIYLGIIPLVLCLYGIKYHFKDFRVKVYLFAMIITYIYACCGQIPFVGKILYHIPVLNSFRVPCRIVSLTVINSLILALYSLHLMIKKRDFINYLKVSFTIFLLTGGSILFLSFLSSPIFNIFNEKYAGYYTSKNLYLPAILLISINLLIAYALFYNTKKDVKKSYTDVFCVLICLITVLDVYHINKDIWSDGYRIQQLLNNPTEDEFNSKVGEYLENLDDIDEYRTVVDFTNYTDYDTFSPDLLGNNNIYHQFMSLQSYLTFQNPYYNTFCKTDNSKFLTSKSLLSEVNSSIISSLSTKYIIKKSIEPNMVYKKIKAENTIYSETTSVDMNCNKDTILSHIVPIKIERNKTYLVNLDIDVTGTPLIFVADLYGGQGIYDFNEQEATLLPYIVEGSNQLSFFLNSGDYEIPEDTCMRIILNGDSKLLIKSIKISEVNSEEIDFYKQIYNDGEYVIYENPEAKPVLYVPTQVECIDNVKKNVNNNMLTSDLANHVYTNDSKSYDLSESKAIISNINVKNNKISGHVVSDTDTFVIMTQTWYPGWKAYIDGKKVQVHLVNNVVQGIEVPQGEHEIEFRFISLTFIIGGVISTFTLIILLYFLIRKSNNRAD